MSSKSSDQLHLVMIPFLAFGHVNPFVRLSNNLCSQGVQITFLSAPSNISIFKSSLNPNPAIQIIPLDFTTECLAKGIASTNEVPLEMFVNLLQALDLMQHQIKTLLLKINPHFLVFDFAQYWIPKLASEVGVKSVHFSIFPPIADADRTVPSRLDGIEGRCITFEDLRKPHRDILKNTILTLESLNPYLKNPHCGFSSLIESAFNDCQLVMSPFKADQFFNARLIARDLKAGIEVKRRDEDGNVKKEDILEAVKTVMLDAEKKPGKQMRENHKRFREFLLNMDIQGSFMSNFVAQLKSMT